MKDDNIENPGSYVKDYFRRLDAQGFLTKLCPSTGVSSGVYVCVVARMLFERSIRPYDKYCEDNAIRRIQAEFLHGRFLTED